MRRRWPLALAAMLGPATFALLEGLQSVFRTDRSFADPMSAYAVGRYGSVQTFAFVALATGSAAVCAGLGLASGRSPNSRLAQVLVGVWSLGVLVAAVFRIDVEESGSAAGRVHGVASMLSFVAVLAAMFCFTAAVRQVEGCRSLHRLSSGLAGTAAVAFIAAGATQHSVGFGVAQRVFLAAVVVWLMAIGRWLSPSATPPGTPDEVS